MLQVCYCGPPRGLGKRAFTLIEIIIALTIVAVIAAVAVPTLKGLNEDEKTRAPLSGLADLVQEVRSRAMREHRPYEIIFPRHRRPRWHLRWTPRRNCHGPGALPWTTV